LIALYAVQQAKLTLAELSSVSPQDDFFEQMKNWTPCQHHHNNITASQQHYNTIRHAKEKALQHQKICMLTCSIFVKLSCNVEFIHCNNSALPMVYFSILQLMATFLYATCNYDDWQSNISPTLCQLAFCLARK
jgi:hypothetical protein